MMESMKGKDIKGSEVNIQEVIEKAREGMASEAGLSPALRVTFELLINVLLLLADRLSKTSKNSNMSPSADPNRVKKAKTKTGKKPGGQLGHTGKHLQPVENPDITIKIEIDREKLPAGKWKSAGFERRQVFDIKITRLVTEYQAEIMINQQGEKITADFPQGISQATQYGNGVKAHAVYMSVYQMIPCERVSEHFADQLNLPISPGSVCNFKQEAYALLETAETWTREQLKCEKVLNLDETGINIDSKRVWLHTVSSPLYTLYMPHEKRGKEAMDAMGILPDTKAVLVHDHWKPYYRYNENMHALCNAHHLRELTAATETGQKWGQTMTDFLVELNKQVDAGGGMLTQREQIEAREKYRGILATAETECPPPPEKPPDQRGRVAKSKTRNLLERLRSFEDDVLRFMTDRTIPFTNNLAERDLRMVKVQQKISGCFRSWEGASIFCRIRHYLSTCQKHDVSAADALRLLFSGHLPGFISI
jgi:transposase